MHFEEFRGRGVVITGALGGIGRAYCRRFLREGAHVLSVDIHEDLPLEAELTAFAHEHHARIAFARDDISDLDRIPAIFASWIHAVGPIDVLVNNAGRNVFKSAYDVTVQDWHNVMTLNVSACFFLAQAYAQHHRERNAGKGRIVNVSST